MKSGLMAVALVGMLGCGAAMADGNLVMVFEHVAKAENSNSFAAYATFAVSFVTVGVSIATYFVARSQKKIASAKVRLDLYNKRFEVFKAALAYHNAIWYGDHEKVKEVGNAFIIYFRESKFLFEKESGIYATLEKMKDSGGVVHGFLVQESLRLNGAHDNADQMGALHESCTKARDGFRDLLTQLEDQLGSYINFRNASGW